MSNRVTPNHLKKLILTVFLFAVCLFVILLQNDSQDKVSTNDEQTIVEQKVQLKPKLRIVTWKGADTYLPRAGHPQDLEVQYLQRFANENSLEFEEISIREFSQLIPTLLSGKGDVIAANLTETDQRKKAVNFTTPFIKTSEFLLMGKNQQSLKHLADLNGRELIVQKGKSYETSAAILKKRYPQLTLRYIDNKISNEQIYDGLASGKYDLTIQDENLINAALGYRTDLSKSIKVSEPQNIGWAVAPTNEVLLNKLNKFLKEQLISNNKKQTKSKKVSQWQSIQEKKTIRFVLRNNLSSYYIWRGELLGFHYELAKRFAEEHKLRYEIFVAPNHIALLDYIIEDKADIALGFFTPTQERIDKGISFSRPYHYASELLIAHKDTKDINNKELYIRRSSAYWQSAEKLKPMATNLFLVPAPENQETESIIADVAKGKYDLTIADNHIVDIEMTFRDNIHSLQALGEPKAQSWAIKSGNTQLMSEVNSFIKKHYKGLFYNVIYNKYFKNTKRIDKHYKGYERTKGSGVLSPYDDTVKRYADKYDFDWRLLVAQMHQESRFNAQAKSMAGAQGLFQVMPRTAKELGITDIHHPEQGIKAGIRYMDWVRERMIANDIPKQQLVWFTLASYNAGAGHVRDAMQLAKQKGWKGDVWFDNVEKAMLLLSQPKYAAKARYGYVRGTEPVNYVRAIKARLDTYKNILPKK